MNKIAKVTVLNHYTWAKKLDCVVLQTIYPRKELRVSPEEAARLLFDPNENDPSVEMLGFIFDGRFSWGNWRGNRKPYSDAFTLADAFLNAGANADYQIVRVDFV